MNISIITVSYNNVSTIEDTILSVAAQGLSGIEHIIVDGGSIDGTLAIIEKYRNKLATIISESDEGIYDAMNKGVAAAAGEVVGFLNADDHYAHSTVLLQVIQVMEQEHLDALYGDVEIFRGNNPQWAVRRYRSSRFRPERIAWGWMPAHPALFVRRSVFARVGPFRTDYRIAGDFEWVARAFRPGVLQYRYLPEVLVRMRMGGISTGGWRNTVLLNREVMRACRENDIPTNWFKILSKYPFKIFEFVYS